ncbi:MAG TPA: toll/interleukin-1 receptor domain-containing protein [Thermoanaerobaculia bacterium]|nr:toll/interleukin-1 receptor domain-containing protein [Thermoanaerobaculia bacterium]
MVVPRDKVFVSYSRDDKPWLDQLLKVLAPGGKLDAVWWDGLIRAGQEWQAEIERALASAKVAVLLVSPGFLASEFILKVELPRLLDAAKREGVAILWSLVRNCWWEKTPLYRYQAIPYQQSHSMRPWNALSESELDALFVLVAKEIDDRLRSNMAPETAVVVPEPQSEVESPATSPQDEAKNAEKLLQGVEDLGIVAEVGDLFVLRRKWSGAKFAYNRLIEIAAPYKEVTMAWGYEKLGLIHRQEGRWKAAGESWRLAQILYRRTGRVNKAAEIERLLEEASVTSLPPK